MGGRSRASPGGGRGRGANRSYDSPYASAGRLVGSHISTGKGLKSLAFGPSSDGTPVSKVSYAIAAKTIQHLPDIEGALDLPASVGGDGGGTLRDAILGKGSRDVGLSYVLLYETMYGTGRLRAGGAAARAIRPHAPRLRDAAPTANAPAPVIRFPRYVRANALRTDASAAAGLLGGSGTVYADALVPDLLVMEPGTDLHGHPSAESGHVVLQDKSSCFSALALAGGEGAAFDAIDACAAPGNKTVHLAALLGGRGGGGKEPVPVVYAFDRDGARAEILRKRVKQFVPSGARATASVEVIHGDFLKSDPADSSFARVRGILLDPSCSGSGIVNQPGRTPGREETGQKERLEKLSGFQLVALKHAMSFPQCEKIVYSTCSLHGEENEAVVAAALGEHNDALNDGEEKWRLTSPRCLRGWSRRGRSGVAAKGGGEGLSSEETLCLVRADPFEGDQTNGFFVAYLEREVAGGSEPDVTAVPIAIPEGLEVYDGQFNSKLPQKSHKEAKSPLSTSGGDLDKNKTERVGDVQLKEAQSGQANRTKDAPPVAKAAKKAAKKKEWKIKQRIAREVRQKKKKSAAPDKKKSAQSVSK